MKEIMSIYESILDDDETTMTNIRRSTITYEYVDEVFNKNPVDGLDTRKYDKNYRLKEDKTLKISKFGSDFLRFSHDLPKDLKISEIDEKILTIYLCDDVTTMEFLPDNIVQQVIIKNCKDFKDFGDVKTVKSLRVVNSNLKSLKGIPKAQKFIHFEKSGDWDEKQISRASGMPKNKITVI